MTAVLCALLLAAACLTAPAPDRSDLLLAASEQQGAASRPLNYPMPEVPR